MSAEQFPSFEAKNEVDTALQAVCEEFSCRVKVLSGSQDDPDTRLVKPVVESGEVDLPAFIARLLEELDPNQTNTYRIVSENEQGNENISVVRIERLT